MNTDAAIELRRLLRAVLDALEVGDWRRASFLLGPVSRLSSVSGSLVRGAVALGAHRSRECSCGRRDSSPRHPISSASPLRSCRGCGATATEPGVRDRGDAGTGRREHRRTPLRGASLDWCGANSSSSRIFVVASPPGGSGPATELIEACIEHLCCVEFDPFAWPKSGQSVPDDGITVDPTPSVVVSAGHPPPAVRRPDERRGHAVRVAGHRRLPGAAGCGAHSARHEGHACPVVRGTGNGRFEGVPRSASCVALRPHLARRS